MESVKTVTDLHAPLSGTVTELNETLIDNPGLINQDPYYQGWILKLKTQHKTEVATLLSALDYEKLIG